MSTESGTGSLSSKSRNQLTPWLGCGFDLTSTFPVGLLFITFFS